MYLLCCAHAAIPHIADACAGKGAIHASKRHATPPCPLGVRVVLMSESTLRHNVHSRSCFGRLVGRQVKMNRFQVADLGKTMHSMRSGTRNQ